jgi:hypothetical protein
VLEQRVNHHVADEAYALGRDALTDEVAVGVF